MNPLLALVLSQMNAVQTQSEHVELLDMGLNRNHYMHWNQQETNCEFEQAASYL
jgi:hypothetical protein